VRDARAKANVDAVLPPARSEHEADVLAEHARDRSVCGLDDRHVHAERARRRGDLSADEATPDHDEMRAGDEFLSERLRVGNRPQLVHARGQVERQPARSRAGCQHELVEPDIGAPVGTGDTLERVDVFDPGAEAELDAAVVPVAVLPQQERVLVARPEQELLRERRPLVWRERLVADQHEAPVVAFAPQRLGGAGAGEAGAHDQNGPGGHAACSSITEMAAMGQTAAASRTAASSLVPVRTEARPSPSSWKICGARSAQAPKPLQSERSMRMRYITCSFRERERDWCAWGG
jgi:hypothetical protein